MSARHATLQVAVAIFVMLLLFTLATTSIAAHYGRAWSVRAYDFNLRQDIRALVAKEQYGAIERIAVSVLKVSPEYESTIREETAEYRYMLPELNALLSGELSAAK